VRWWDDEFWATLAITMFSVAVTIALTVIISWWIVSHQLTYERELQNRQREEQLADLRAEVERDQRIRQAEGLAERLHALAEAVELSLHPLLPGLGRHQPRVADALQALDASRARLDAGSQLAVVLENLRRSCVLWNGPSYGDSADTSEEWTRAWEQGALALVDAIRALISILPVWEATGGLGEHPDGLMRASGTLASAMGRLREKSAADE
jgi:hypothetical protein